MIAIRVHRFGGPEELHVEQTPVPEPQPGEALVRVHAAGVGPWDALVRSGNSGLSQALPLTPGSDIAGIVERVRGDDATSIAVGDEVFGVTNAAFTGGYAQYAVAELRSLARKPKSLGFAEAASVPVVAVTAWKMLFEHAHLTAGQSVLVIGGAGNVGAYAVQLAAWAGARVTAVGSGQDAPYMKSRGAAATIDFQTQRFEESVADVDVVIDTTGGDTQTRAFGVLKAGGILVSSVSQPSEAEARKHDVRVAFFIVDVPRAELERVAGLIDDGILKTDLGVVLPLSSARRAHEMLAGTVDHPRGKIVLDTMLQGE
ncbi:MAG TPA: NADP-dependent oxidoreductase [Candidatus Tumulicola sp.]|jgi:NADPH:quinone reductase-like Zn-dependent oxidoreductase